MKRLISILAVLCIFSLLIIPVSAEIYFCFTPDSSPVPGGKLQVDVEAMSAYDETLKKAWQAGKVRFEWYENGVLMPNETTDTLHFTQEHVGKAYSVWVIIPEFSLECPPIEVQKAVFSAPVQPMQDGTVGQPYYTKLICTITILIDCTIFYFFTFKRCTFIYTNNLNFMFFHAAHAQLLFDSNRFHSCTPT